MHLCDEKASSDQIEGFVEDQRYVGSEVVRLFMPIQGKRVKRSGRRMPIHLEFKRSKEAGSGETQVYEEDQSSAGSEKICHVSAKQKSSRSKFKCPIPDCTSKPMVHLPQQC